MRIVINNCFNAVKPALLRNSKLKYNAAFLAVSSHCLLCFTKRSYLYAITARNSLSFSKIKYSKKLLNSSRYSDLNAVNAAFISSTSHKTDAPHASEAKVGGGSDVRCSNEGPVVHHAHHGAVVITKSKHTVANKHLLNPPSYSLLRRPQSTVALPDVDSQSDLMPEELFISNKDEFLKVNSENLISNTTTHIRRLNEFEQSNGSTKSTDIEYVVEKLGIPKPSLIGALPPKALDWRPVAVNYSQLPAVYASLAKSRLTGLVVATALGGYVLCPCPFVISSLLGVTVGTALISAAANTTNQIMEAPYDAQMKRTQARVLVRGDVSSLHAAAFASVCGVSGVSLLWSACNPLTAALGLTNLFLYTALYTPMKRSSIANTWVGAIVGSIPPLMGWCGCSGVLIGHGSWGAWILAGLLYAWQFPHFNALSWNLRADYSSAGYRMMCVTNPRLCKVTCVRYSLMLLALGFAAPALGVTTWTFAIDSTPLNAYMLYLSYRFYRDGDSKSSRKLFFYSLIHLPAIMVLMIISKNYSAKKDAAAGSESSSSPAAHHALPPPAVVDTTLSPSSSSSPSQQR